MGSTEGWNNNELLEMAKYEDAPWYMLRHVLSSAQDDFFLYYTAASLMIQTTEVLRSSQVCFYTTLSSKVHTSQKKK